MRAVIIKLSACTGAPLPIGFPLSHLRKPLNTPFTNQRMESSSPDPIARAE